MALPSSEVAPGALVDEVAERIREMILSGDIPIGAQLRQAALADACGVSRMPVREALRQLQNGGLITILPNRGAVVRTPAPWEVREVYEIRAELEALAARRAAGRISPVVIEELREVNEQMRRRVGAQARGEPVPSTQRHRGNETFHGLIAAAAENEHLRGTVDELNRAYPRNILAQLLAEDPCYCAANGC